MIGDGVREIEWGTVVVCAIEVIERRNRQESAVAKGSHPGEIQVAVVFVLGVHLDDAVGDVCWINRHLVEVST